MLYAIQDMLIIFKNRLTFMFMPNLQKIWYASKIFWVKVTRLFWNKWHYNLRCLSEFKQHTLWTEASFPKQPCRHFHMVCMENNFFTVFSLFDKQYYNLTQYLKYCKVKQLHLTTNCCLKLTGSHLSKKNYCIQWRLTKFSMLSASNKIHMEVIVAREPANKFESQKSCASKNCDRECCIKTALAPYDEVPLLRGPLFCLLGAAIWDSACL